MGEFYCATATQNSKVEMAGTANHFQRYILLEYPHPFKEKAIRDSIIPEMVTTHLQNYLKQVNGKLLLIRQEQKNTTALTVFFYDSISLCFNKKTISTYQELIDLNLDRYFTIDAIPQVTENHFFICTNGTRDQCCAKFGYPIYKQFQSLQPKVTWQCSHLSGHRFAPTGLFLPSGIYYGHIQRDSVPQMIDAAMNNEVYLTCYRGRTAYRRHEQAAEYFLRQALGQACNQAIELIDAHPLGVHLFEVFFKITQSNQKYRVKVAQIFQHLGYLKCKSQKSEYLPEFCLHSLALMDEAL